MKEHWYLVGCALIGALQAVEAWRVVRRAGYLAPENLAFSVPEIAWVLLSVGVFFMTNSQAWRLMALALMIYAVTMTVMAQRGGDIQRAMREAEEVGSFDVSKLRMSPKLMLWSFGFSVLWSVAALGLLFALL